MNTIGKIYKYSAKVLDRSIVNSDFEKATKYCELAKKEGNSVAMAKFGKYYFKLGEREFNENRANAFKYYKLAAINGNADGQNNLGQCYFNGYGIVKDYKEAFKYFRLAAEQGHAPCNEDICEAYESSEYYKHHNIDEFAKNYKEKQSSIFASIIKGIMAGTFTIGVTVLAF